MSDAAFSPDGRRIVGVGDKAAYIWDARTGARLATLRGHPSCVLSAEFDSSGERVLTRSDDGTVWVWDAATGAKVAELLGHRASVTTAHFAHRGLEVVTAGDDRTVRVWEPPQVTVLGGPHRDWVLDAAFSPNGRYAATSTRDGLATIWDLASGTPRKRWHATKDEAYAISFAGRDGSTALISTQGRKSRVWRWDWRRRGARA